MAREDKKSRNGTFWAKALERAHLGVWDWDLATGDCFYSATWARMLGYDESELAKTSDLWLRLTHPDDRERAQAILSRVNAGSVYFNCCDRVSPRLPWSGRRHSGIGTTLSRLGIEAFLQPKAWHLRLS